MIMENCVQFQNKIRQFQKKMNLKTKIILVISNFQL